MKKPGTITPSDGVEAPVLIEYDYKFTFYCPLEKVEYLAKAADLQGLEIRVKATDLGNAKVRVRGRGFGHDDAESATLAIKVALKAT